MPEGASQFIAKRLIADSYLQSTLTPSELRRVFLRYASATHDRGLSPPASPAQTSLELATQSVSIAKEAEAASVHVDVSGGSPRPVSPSRSPSSRASGSPPVQGLTLETAVMSLRGFTTLLLSTDNSAFTDQHGKIYHDMTHPLADYYISSSHNTYLVGHQLVGESTIEGYIRALLHSCRSVERKRTSLHGEPRTVFSLATHS